MGAEIGISGGMAYRVATSDYEPRDNAIRKLLGLPQLARAPICPTCGVVHVRKTCPVKHKSGKRRPRRRILPPGPLWAALGRFGLTGMVK